MVFEQLDLLRVLQLEGLEIVKQSLHVMAALLGHTYAALPNLCYHLLVGTHDRLFPHQLQWRYQHWHVQSMFGDAVRDLLDPRLRGGAGRSSGPRRKRTAARLRDGSISPPEGYRRLRHYRSRSGQPSVPDTRGAES